MLQKMKITTSDGQRGDLVILFELQRFGYPAGRSVAYAREIHFAYARVTFGKSNKPKAPENPKRCFGTNTSLCMLALTFGLSP